MTMHNRGITIDFSQVKASKTEILRQAVNRIFEFNNIILSVVNAETGVLKMTSFAYDGVSQYFDYKSIFRLCFLRIGDVWEHSNKVNNQKICS